MTPAARSAAMLREQGYRIAFVEKRVPGKPITQDAFGFGDLLAIRADEPPIMVQVTTAANQAARLHKAEALPALAVWLATGSRFVIHGWSKKGPRGAVKRWVCDSLEVERGGQLAAEGGG